MKTHKQCTHADMFATIRAALLARNPRHVLEFLGAAVGLDLRGAPESEVEEFVDLVTQSAMDYTFEQEPYADAVAAVDALLASPCAEYRKPAA